ncbi:hypothetical protein GCK72_021940 [Caenorhabditis remanei]|uniref:Uncharacterized protein n=1 Tax=Caenorhabditis remanei TaxID=31234 RepID=A0A6A5GLA3_CAERE|nr:hypothetical protein GCK72_021940 [Caenorhabditis remanei]KAF1755371.1 hypothetical protein GCK72_021940 [Caenorhabditis remanei]
MDPPKASTGKLASFMTGLVLVFSITCLAAACLLVMTQSCDQEIVTVELAPRTHGDNKLYKIHCPSFTTKNETEKIEVEITDDTFEHQKEEFLVQAISDKNVLESLYVNGAHSPEDSWSNEKKLYSFWYNPDPARFQGVDELLQLTGNNQTLAKFLTLGRVRSKTQESKPTDLMFYVTDRVFKKEIVIGGCAYSNTTCHETSLLFVKNDLYVYEKFVSEFAVINFVRVFYIPAEDLLSTIII